MLLRLSSTYTLLQQEDQSAHCKPFCPHKKFGMVNTTTFSTMGARKRSSNGSVICILHCGTCVEEMIRARTAKNTSLSHTYLISFSWLVSLSVTFSTARLDTSLMMSLGRTTTSISACYGVREKQARKHPRNHDTAGFCHFCCGFEERMHTPGQLQLQLRSIN